MMNRTTKVAVALIVAAGLSTMVYALPALAITTPKIKAGAVSISTNFVFGNTVTVGPDKELGTSIDCSSLGGDYHLTGGGYAMEQPPSSPVLQVVTNIPSTDGWKVIMYNPSSSQSSQFRAFAMCATIVP